MTDAAEARRLADLYAKGQPDEALLAPAADYWRRVTRDLTIPGEGDALSAEQAILPWLAHDAMIHLTVPHGLEQYTGAAWGTRDVCQGPLEFMLALRHDETARDILTTLFAEQYRTRGDWPQWFMLPPYSNIRAGEAHGDIVVWPLKALCDYIEATGDLGILDISLPWRRDDDLKLTAETGTIREHVELLLATVRARFIPGTHLIRYGEGDWNDSLQPPIRTCATGWSRPGPSPCSTNRSSALPPSWNARAMWPRPRRSPRSPASCAATSIAT